MYRKVLFTAKADPVNMGGIFIDQALPLQELEQVDPFLLIHHWRDEFPGGQKQEEVGVGPHPHRGFAPVTLIFEGAVHHRDSEGYDSIVEAGGTQWMNSGKGIIHSERPSRKIAEQGGLYEIIQFWVNAPATNKLDEPKYQSLSKEETPSWKSKDGLVDISLVAGELGQFKSPIQSYTPLHVVRFEFQQDGRTELTVPSSANTLIYVLNGSLDVNGTLIEDKSIGVFASGSEPILLRAMNDTRAIILSGEPINEPLATYGPFVMNNSRELMNAIQDYQAGKMGSLIESFV